MISTADHRRRVCVDPLEVVPTERTAASCRFKEGVAKVVRTPLSGDLAPSSEASFDRVRAKFDTKDATTVTAVAQGALEAGKTCRAIRDVGAWRDDMGFDLDLPHPRDVVKGPYSKSLTRANPFLCTQISQPPSVLLKAIVRGSQLPPGGVTGLSHSIGLDDFGADVSALIFRQSLLFKSGCHPYRTQYFGRSVRGWDSSWVEASLFARKGKTGN